MLGDEVVFDIDELTFCIDPFKGMSSVSMTITPSFGCTVITEEHEAGVVTFGCIFQKVKYTIVVEKKVLRIAVLGSNDIWSLDRISTEENGLA